MALSLGSFDKLRMSGRRVPRSWGFFLYPLHFRTFPIIFTLVIRAGGQGRIHRFRWDPPLRDADSWPLGYQTCWFQQLPAEQVRFLVLPFRMTSWSDLIWIQ